MAALAMPDPMGDGLPSSIQTEVTVLGAMLLDAVAIVANLFRPGKADVRRGDYHVILRKR